jgi:hypothetical protein
MNVVTASVWRFVTDWAFALIPSRNNEDLLSGKLHRKIQFLPQNKHRTSILKKPAVFYHQAANQLHIFAFNKMKCDHNDQSTFFKFHFYVLYLHLVLTRFLFPLSFLTTSICALLSATCPTHLDNIFFLLLFFIIKPISYTNFPKYILSWNSTCSGQFVCPSSGVYSLYTQQRNMSYRFVDSFRAGPGWFYYKEKKVSITQCWPHPKNSSRFSFWYFWCEENKASCSRALCHHFFIFLQAPHGVWSAAVRWMWTGLDRTGHWNIWNMSAFCRMCVCVCERERERERE